MDVAKHMEFEETLERRVDVESGGMGSPSKYGEIAGFQVHLYYLRHLKKETFKGVQW
jgi:hypothetical protein